MYIYIKGRKIINTEQVSEIGVYKKTNAEWRLYAISGGEESRIASCNNELSAEMFLDSIMSAIKENVKVLDLDTI